MDIDKLRGYLFTEWGFRVGLSSWTFELDFRVGFSSSTTANIDVDIDYIINCISCLITNNCVIFLLLFTPVGGFQFNRGGCNLETLCHFME